MILQMALQLIGHDVEKILRLRHAVHIGPQPERSASGIFVFVRSDVVVFAHQREHDVAAFERMIRIAQRIEMTGALDESRQRRSLVEVQIANPLLLKVPAPPRKT